MADFSIQRYVCLKESYGLKNCFTWYDQLRNLFILCFDSLDLKTMTDVAGNPEEERHTDFYYQPWAQEAVCRYFYSKIQQKRQELDSALGIRNG